MVFLCKNLKTIAHEDHSDNMDGPDDQGELYDEDQLQPEKLLDRTNVFIKYLPTTLTDTGLYTLFAPYGEILSAKVMVDPVTSNSLGYGFVDAR